MRRSIFFNGLLIGCLVLSSVLAQSATSDAATPVIEEVVAVGVQPGPKMWRINKDGRELWIFGTLTPIPKKMAWDSVSVEAILGDAEEVIYPPGVTVSANPLKGVLALPLLWGIQNNPDKQKLVDILPEELYARWITLKELYIGRDRGIEKHRPIFAAQKLYAKAIDSTGLESSARVHKKIRKLIKKNDVPVTETSVARSLNNPRAQLKKFKRSSINDVDCFRKTIERLEVDLERMQSRAAAWSQGDVKTLKALPHQDQNKTCIDAVLESAFGAELAEASDLVDVEARLKQNWIDAAELALSQNAVTFAILPIDELLDDEGYLAHFRSGGYEVRGG